MFGRNKERPMQVATKEVTNFSYIDAAVMERVKEDHAPRDSEKQRAKEDSRAIIAGFPILDPDREKYLLDEMIKKRNESIQRFIDDRKAVVATLGKMGVEPLAVVPSKAWVDICRRANLAVMSPDSQGRVTVSREAFVRYGSAKAAEAAALKDHKAYVQALFPQTMQAGAYARVVLPTPPAEVAAILLKARGLKLNVAAVPEAIRFVETPTELYDSATIDPKDEWARRQGYADYKDWVKRDPIVFHDHGTASAIIAQFGDFPIEKQVVDMVMAGNKLIPEAPAAMPLTANLFAANSVNRAYQQMIYEQQRMLSAGQIFVGGGVGAVGAGGVIHNSMYYQT